MSNPANQYTGDTYLHPDSEGFFSVLPYEVERRRWEAALGNFRLGSPGEGPMQLQVLLEALLQDSLDLEAGAGGDTNPTTAADVVDVSGDSPGATSTTVESNSNRRPASRGDRNLRQGAVASPGPVLVSAPVPVIDLSADHADIDIDLQHAEVISLLESSDQYPAHDALSAEQLFSLPLSTYVVDHGDVGGGDKICTICMTEFEAGKTKLVTLPCSHRSAMFVSRLGYAPEAHARSAAAM